MKGWTPSPRSPSVEEAKLNEHSEVYILQAVAIYKHHDADRNLLCTIFPTPKIELKISK